MSKHKDHRVIMGGFVSGEWYEWDKNSLLIMFNGAGCDPFYSGTKKQGFSTCHGWIKRRLNLLDAGAGKRWAKAISTCWWLVEGGSSSGAEAVEEATEEEEGMSRNIYFQYFSPNRGWSHEREKRFCFFNYNDTLRIYHNELQPTRGRKRHGGLLQFVCDCWCSLPAPGSSVDHDSVVIFCFGLQSDQR